MDFTYAFQDSEADMLGTTVTKSWKVCQHAEFTRRYPTAYEDHEVFV